MRMTELAVILNYSTSVWGASKTDRAVSQEVLTAKGAEDKAGKFTKHLLGGNCPELEMIRTHVQHFQSWIRTATFPSSMMGRGSTIVPNGKLLEICRECRRYEQQFYVLVDDFISKYDDIVLEAKKKLADLATDDYPSKDAIREKFNFSFNVMPIPESSGFDGKLGLTELEQTLADQYERQLSDTFKEGEEQLIDLLIARLQKFRHALSTYTGEGRGSGAILSQKVSDAALEEAKNIKSLNFRKRTDINRWCLEAIRIFEVPARDYRVSQAIRTQALRNVEELLISMGVTLEVEQPVNKIVVEEQPDADFNYADLFSHTH